MREDTKQEHQVYRTAKSKYKLSPNTEYFRAPIFRPQPATESLFQYPHKALQVVSTSPLR